jgi:hypothetical protein
VQVTPIRVQGVSLTNQPVRKLGLPQCVFKNNPISFKQKQLTFFERYVERIDYTIKHKKAFLEMERKLTGKNTLSGYLHDLDKLIMYFFAIPRKYVHNIHVSYALHHEHNGKIKKPVQAIIDWECSRFTKPVKQRTARQYYEDYYLKERNHRIPEIEEGFEKFGL